VGKGVEEEPNLTTARKPGLNVIQYYLEKGFPEAAGALVRFSIVALY
jgi:hypothetical protein